MKQKKIEITIGGKRYPCRQTMGAMLRFKRETGKEVTEIGQSVSDLCVFLWCCTASACNADGIEFPYQLDDFADLVTAEQMASWNAAVNDAAGAAEGADQEENPSR